MEFCRDTAMLCPYGDLSIRDVLHQRGICCMSVEQRRGIETIDRNQNLLLVRAPIESVAQRLSRARRADVWERDIYDREIEITTESYIVFQFRGHPQKSKL